MTDRSRWVGKDEHQGIPSLKRPDATEPLSWSLEAIACVERPHDARLSLDGSAIAAILDRETSDVWVVPVTGGAPTRVTTGRALAAFWEDDAATWSPDGNRLAYSADGSVWIVDVAGGLPTRVAKGSSPQWVGSEELVFTVERDEESRLVRARIDDPWPQALTPPGQNVSGGWVAPGEPVLLYVNHPSDDRQRSDIWLVDLETGEATQITDEPGMQSRCPRLAPDSRSVAFTSEQSGWNEIHIADRDGAASRQITSESADFSSLCWHPNRMTILARRTRRGVDDLVEVEPESGEVRVLRAGGQWTPLGWSKEGEAIAIHEAHDLPPRLVAVAGEAEVRTVFAGVPASVKAATYAKYEEIEYPSFDGMTIHGFLFRPPGAEKGHVPAVVYPHGGPTSAYGDEWDGHAQYFVEKGYAWFAINFRGSTGYGRDFERANHDVWGVKDTEDCLAAADFLASLGWVDPSRIGIFGSSYGSYLALSSLARDPQHRFACGVAKYGDSDIATSWAQGDRVGREDLEKMMGKPSENRDAYREGSPYWWVADIERPIFVAHGAKDARVPPDQSEQLVAELKRLGKTYEYVTYPTEGHGFLRFEPQVHFYERLERFLDWHLM